MPPSLFGRTDGNYSCFGSRHRARFLAIRSKSNEPNPPAAAKVTIAVTRLSHGNFSSVKGVGGGVHEYKIDFGPGYRMYFGRDGERVILLLGGGTKKRQQEDIADAQSRWQDYKRRKKQEIR